MESTGWGVFPSQRDGRGGSRKKYRDPATDRGNVGLTLKQEIAEG